MRGVYYNEIDKFSAAWLRELMRAALIPEGEVDERSIVDVQASDLRSFRQCHFFAGIGGWPYALRLAGWPDDQEVWTGSCPCQPLSVAGKRQGHADERHLWPAFYRLIAERRPATVFGEQVASKDGREWFAGVRADLEDARYACGAANLPACGVGAPHRRPRLYWVADADGKGRNARINGCAGMGYRSSSFSDGDRSFWGDFEAHEGDDGTLRRTGPGIFALAHGLPGRVGRLRGYGNAIVPQVAQAFIEAFIETEFSAARGVAEPS